MLQSIRNWCVVCMLCLVWVCENKELPSILDKYNNSRSTVHLLNYAAGSAEYTNAYGLGRPEQTTSNSLSPIHTTQNAVDEDDVSYVSSDKFTVSTTTMLLLLGRTGTFYLVAPDDPQCPTVVYPITDISGIVDVPYNVTLNVNTSVFEVTVDTMNPGSCVIHFNVSNDDPFGLSNIYVRVEVARNEYVNILIIIVGWTYFVAWGVSCYPQVVMNYRRKSVVGVHFDYYAYNMLGFIAYCAYNIGLFWIPVVWEEYNDKHPGGVNPVQLNDVVFTLHGSALCLVVIIQMVIYDRGGQRVSTVCIGMCIVSGVIAAVGLILTLKTDILDWFHYLLYVSYIKLIVTLRYVPQIYFNHKRKSTIGWSTGSIVWDLVGGLLSLVQMFLICYNYDDWVSILGDPTKFGLGLLTILFDVILILQHVIFCHNAKQKDTESKKYQAEFTLLEKDEKYVPPAKV